MLETLEETTPCEICGFHSDDHRDFVIAGPTRRFICENSSACLRRKKRDAILAEMQEMAKKPRLHPVDKFSRTSVALCGFFLGCVTVICGAYLMFGI